MTYRFNPSTGITVTEVFSNSLTYARPPVNEFIGGSSSRVSCCRAVVVGIDNFPIHVFIIRDVEEAISI